jgi:peptidoglycan/xylan/chitin deacetylase (PgdA/CDA1 family)
VFRLSRRRIVLGAVCAGLVVLPAIGGWSAGRSFHAGAAPSVSSVPSSAGLFSAQPPSAQPPSAQPSSTGPSSAGPALFPSEPALVVAPSGGVPAVGGAPTLPPGFSPPAGWKLSDVPRFPPAPAPEPIVLPPGDEIPYLSRVPVTQPVAFLTIDDGFLKNPEAPKLFAAAGIPVTLFLTTDAIQDDVPYFDRLRTYGAVIEAHTISHPEMRGRSYGFQRHQICDGTDRLAQWYGRRPVLFRPPFGDKDHTTLRVAKECGLRAGFMWKETVDKGKVRYQEGKTVQRGDIILMHFRPAFVKDFLAALRAIRRAGLTPALLEDYVPLDAPGFTSAPHDPRERPAP